MAFWSSETLHKQIPALKIVEPFDPSSIKHAAYELHLGTEVYQTSSAPEVKQVIGSAESFPLPPGQFALLITNEIVTIPNTSIGLISIKGGIKSRGLINVSGFHVDPGFSGQLHFAVYNAGTKNIVLTQGDAVFLLWLCGLDMPTDDKYDGKHNHQRGLTSDEVMMIQGEVASPAALKTELSELKTEMEKKCHDIEHSVTVLRTIAISLVVGIIMLVLGAYVKQSFDAMSAAKSASATPPTQTHP